MDEFELVAQIPMADGHIRMIRAYGLALGFEESQALEMGLAAICDGLIESAGGAPVVFVEGMTAAAVVARQKREVAAGSLQATAAPRASVGAA